MKVKLNNVRLAFPNIFDAKAVQPGQDAKFSAAFLFPRDHPCVAELQKALVSVANEKWGGRAAQILQSLKAAGRMCVHDGETKGEYEGYAGNLFVNASNAMRPLVVDEIRQPLTIQDGRPYSGCYVNGIVQIWAQDNQYGKRINASLMGVQFVRDGERLAGAQVATEDDFEAIPEAAAEEVQTGGGASASGVFAGDAPSNPAPSPAPATPESLF